jgi:hypothetical protein
MKLSSWAICLAIVPFFCTTIWAFLRNEDTGVRGTVSPLEAVQSVSVIANGKDSIKAVTINGAFSAPVKPGLYQVFVDAGPGYKDMLLERIVVEEGRMTDVGALVLEKNIP